MKNYIFLLILFLGYIPHCYSQQENNKVRFGLRAGMNLSHLNFSRVSLPSEKPLEMSWQAGGAGGLFMIVPLHESFFIQPEYLFSQTGGKAESSNLHYNLNYLSLPVFLRWEMRNRFSFILGPQFDLLINADQKNQTSEITAHTESRKIERASCRERV